MSSVMPRFFLQSYGIPSPFQIETISSLFYLEGIAPDCHTIYSTSCNPWIMTLLHTSILSTLVLQTSGASTYNFWTASLTPAKRRWCFVYWWISNSHLQIIKKKLSTRWICSVQLLIVLGPVNPISARMCYILPNSLSDSIYRNCEFRLELPRWYEGRVIFIYSKITFDVIIETSSSLLSRIQVLRERACFCPCPQLAWQLDNPL